MVRLDRLGSLVVLSLVVLGLVRFMVGGDVRLLRRGGRRSDGVRCCGDSGGKDCRDRSGQEEKGVGQVHGEDGMVLERRWRRDLIVVW